MSKVAIKGADTGTGVFTIESPATNTDRILTLPDEAGTILTSGGAIDVDTSAPADSVAIDASGNVGIGKTTTYATDYKLDILGATNAKVGVEATSGVSSVVFRNTSGAHLQNVSATPMQFFTNNAEAMRIDSSGTLRINATSQLDTPSKLSVKVDSGVAIETGTTTATNHYGLWFVYNTTQKGYTLTTSTGTTYNTTSDARMKENITDLVGGTDLLKQMRPVEYTWIDVPEAGVCKGFVAQELKSVVPEAVSGNDGDEVMMGVDYGKVTPILTAALQEAIGRIETLEARVATLEGGAA